MQYIGSDIFYYLFLAGNVPLILHDGFPFLAHYWSLGVEEQFYLIWPLVVKFCNRSLLKIMLITAAVLVIAKSIFWQFYYDPPVRSIVAETLRTLRFENMLVGAILAYICVNYTRLSDFMTAKYFQAISWVVMVVISFEIIHFTHAISEVLLSCAACFIIASQVKIEKSIIKLEQPILNFLGKISYGIYVFHPLIIYLVSRIVKHYDFSLPVKYIIAFGGAGFATIFTAYLSYQFFERRFLRLKDSFVIIKSY